MIAAPEQLARERAATPAHRRGLVWHGAALLVLVAAVALAFSSTFGRMISVWSHSATYTHGFLILPLVLWMLWRRRDVLFRHTTAMDPLALPVLAVLGLTWLVGVYAGIDSAAQFAVVGMLSTAVWLAFGRAVARGWLFPLCFLLLAVPFGSFLVPPLMELTADATVTLVRLSGVPVFRDGLYFSLPSGNWSVVEACSGQRYLIASFTLGLLFAYLNYRTTGRRVAFVVASIVVPIVANALRAYGIVMLGHLSGMKLAVGVDHLIYGWVFFGVVMLLLFWVGSFWRQAPAGQSPMGETTASAPVTGRPRTRHGAVFVAALASVLIWPAYATVTEARVQPQPLSMELPAGIDGWTLSDRRPAWEPRFQALSQERIGVYRRDGVAATLYIGHYARQSGGRELVMWGNELVPAARTSPRDWRLLARHRQVLETGSGHAVTTTSALLGRGEERLRLYFSYLVDGRPTPTATGVKWLTLQSRLLGRPASGTLVAVAVPAAQDGAASRRFAAAAMQRLAAHLQETAGGGR